MHFITLLVLPIVATLVSGETRTVDNSCPSAVLEDNEDLYLQVHGDFCFHFVLHKKRVYDAAEEDCVQNGGTLALVKTPEINDFLTDMMLNFYTRPEPVWIGLHDKQDEDTFVWEDGSSTNWTNFAPSNGAANWLPGLAEDCVAIDPADDGLWHDFQCEQNFLSWVTNSQPAKTYICQYPIEDEEDGQVKTDAADEGDGAAAEVEQPCDLDCGMDGRKTDGNGQPICECNE